MPRSYCFITFLFLTILVANCIYAMYNFYYIKYNSFLIFPTLNSISGFLAMKDKELSSFTIPSLPPLTNLYYFYSLTSSFCLNTTLFNAGLPFSPPDSHSLYCSVLPKLLALSNILINNSFIITCVVCLLSVVCKLQESREFFVFSCYCLLLESQHLRKCLADS